MRKLKALPDSVSAYKAKAAASRTRSAVNLEHRQPSKLHTESEGKQGDKIFTRKEFVVATQGAAEATPYLTRDQLAARYQVCVRTISYWADSGVLPVYIRGHVVRFHIEECDAAFKKFRRKSRWESTNEKDGHPS